MKNIFNLFLSYVLIVNCSVNAYAEATSGNLISSNLELQQNNNTITPINMNDPSIIYIKESVITDQKYVSFIFCKDRNVESSCILLGGKSFSVAKLEEHSAQLKIEQDNLLKKSRELRKVREEKRRDSNIAKNTFVGVWYAGSVIILTVASGAFVGSLFVGLLALVPGLFVAQNIDFDRMVGLTYAEAEYNYNLRKQFSDSHSTNRFLLNPSRTQSNLSELAQSLHQFLSDFETQTSPPKIINP